jgi:hypothetical protein
VIVTFAFLTSKPVEADWLPPGDWMKPLPFIPLEVTVSNRGSASAIVEI